MLFVVAYSPEGRIEDLSAKLILRQMLRKLRADSKRDTMERTVARCTLLIAVLIGVTFIHGEKVCSGIDADRTSGIDADRGRARIAIVGQEHAILRHYLNRAGNRLDQPLDNTIKSVLLRNGPEPYGRGWRRVDRPMGWCSEWQGEFRRPSHILRRAQRGWVHSGASGLWVFGRAEGFRRPGE